MNWREIDSLLNTTNQDALSRYLIEEVISEKHFFKTAATIIALLLGGCSVPHHDQMAVPAHISQPQVTPGSSATNGPVAHVVMPSNQIAVAADQAAAPDESQNGPHNFAIQNGSVYGYQVALTAAQRAQGEDDLDVEGNFVWLKLIGSDNQGTVTIEYVGDPGLIATLDQDDMISIIYHGQVIKRFAYDPMKTLIGAAFEDVIARQMTVSGVPDTN